MAVKIEKRSLEKRRGSENVTLFEIGTPELTARVLDYGATVQALLVTDQDGKTVDVVPDKTRSRAGGDPRRLSRRVCRTGCEPDWRREFTLNGKT